MDTIQSLVADVRVCATCNTLMAAQFSANPMPRVMHPKANYKAEVLFVFDRPAHNNVATGFSSERTIRANHLRALMASTGIEENDVLTTYAALCCHNDGLRNESKPNMNMFYHCSGFLRRLMKLVNPPVVCVFGNVALDALKFVEPHLIRLSAQAGRRIPWYDRILIPLYHPSSTALKFRTALQQALDWKSIKVALDEVRAGHQNTDIA